MSYQLKKKDLAESFDFEIGENKYTMRYLTGPQRKEMADLTKQVNKLEIKAKKAMDQGDDEALDAIQTEGEPLGQKMSDLLNSIITSSDENTEPIQDVLEREIAPVVRNFQEMMRVEQSLDLPPNVKPNFA